MEKKLEMTSDGINLYLRLFVKSNKKGLVVLSILLMVIVSSFLYMVVQDAEEISTATGFSVILGLLIFLWFSVKYYLWNLYGVEHLIINGQTISYSYDYGWYQTNFETIEFNTLGVTLDEMRLNDKDYLRQMYFYDYDAKTKLPENIHSKTVFLSMEQILEIQVGIRSLFEISFYCDRGFIPFSNN